MQMSCIFNLSKTPSNNWNIKKNNWRSATLGPTDESIGFYFHSIFIGDTSDSVWKLIHNYPTSIKSLVQRNVCREFLQLNSLSTYSLFDTSQTLDLAFRGSMGEINRNNRLNTQKRLNGSMRAASCSGALSLISQSLTNPLRLCPLQLLIPQSPFSLFCLAIILPPCWTYYSISLLYTR